MTASEQGGERGAFAFRGADRWGTAHTGADARTLGSLGAADLGMVITIQDGPLNIQGVLAEVRHIRGDTSGRPITQVRLVWRRDGDTLRSGGNLSRTHGFRYGHDRELRLPDASDTPVQVRPEVPFLPEEGS